MKITERLNAEHGVFLGLLEQLEELLAQAPSDEAAGAVARTLVRTFEPHCRVEDRLLYPALKAVFGPEHPPLAAMEADHRDLDAMAQTIAEGGCDRELLAAYAGAARAHIEREIHAVFPLAEEWIPEEKLRGMCDWYVEHVRERAARSLAG